MMKGFEAKAQMIREDDTKMICDYTGYDPDESVPKHGNPPFPLQKDALQEVFQKKDREQRRACLRDVRPQTNRRPVRWQKRRNGL